MSTKRIATFLMVAGSLIFTPLASAGPAVMCPAGAANHSTSDAVVCWNEIASEIVLGPQGVPAIISMAKIHGAIHDAVQAYEHRFEPYAIDIASGAGSSSAAVAKAARDVLVAVIPAQQGAVDTRYMNFLNLNGLMGNAGISTGAQAAAAMIALRATDGSFPTPAPTFFGAAGPGQWRPTTDPATSMAAPWLADVTPFTLNNPAQLRPHGPPHLESGLYARDYQEVRYYGGVNSATTPTLRTQPQTDLAIFYSDNFMMLWQRTLRGIATANVGSLDESARMFALANLSAADAAIGAWDAKKYYNFWRPITAIRNADTDGNAETIADPTWTPFTGTPNYPDYTSGANNLTGSMAGALSNFFGRDKLTFTVESRFQNVIRTKTYERFSDMCQDVVDVRIYQGIHFRFADEVAFTTGKQAANWVSAHFLRPIRGAGRGNR
jgi:hypothetical protein